MSDTAEAAEVPGLSATESRQLDKLLAKANSARAPHSPAVRVGREYVALTNLSMPRRGDKDKGCDLVMAGESVWLTDDEAALYLRHGERDGRQVAVIRLKSEVDANNPPKPHPMLVSGRPFRPAPPAPGTDQPRPDPEGSSRIVSVGPPVPEMNQPQPGPDMPLGGLAGGDAMDILPGGGGLSRATVAGADQDLVAAVKNQAGLGPAGNRR